MLLCSGGLVCVFAIPLLPVEAGWRAPVELVLLGLFLAGMVLGGLWLVLGFLFWFLGANLPLFLPALLLGAVDRNEFRQELQDPFIQWLWRWQLYLLPPVMLVAAVALLMG
jgi:hypothetical protein